MSFLPNTPENTISSADQEMMAQRLATRLMSESETISRIHDLSRASCEESIKEAIEALGLLVKNWDNQ